MLIYEKEDGIGVWGGEGQCLAKRNKTPYVCKCRGARLLDETPCGRQGVMLLERRHPFSVEESVGGKQKEDTLSVLGRV